MPADSGVGARVRAHRQRRGLTVRELAAQAGISHGHLSKIENSNAAPSSDVLEEIAVVLGVPAIELAFHDPETCRWCLRQYDAPARYVSLTDEKHVIEAITPEFAELLGYTPEELHGRSSYDLIDTATARDNPRRRRELARNGEHADLMTLVHRNGTPISFHYRMRALHNGRRIYYVLAGQPLASLMLLLTLIVAAHAITCICRHGNICNITRDFDLVRTRYG